MSSEELAVLAKEGRKDCMAELWEQLEGFVKWQAGRVITVLGGRGGVEFGDLYNSGYLALVAAVDSYRPDKAGFSTWFMYYLKTAFAEATGYRTKKGRTDPLQNATSLSQTIGAEADGGTLGEIIPDPAGRSLLESVEDCLWREQLQAALESVLTELPPQQGTVLRRRYYDGQTVAEAARRLGFTEAETRKHEKNGLHALRQPKAAKRLRPFCCFDYYGGTGLGAFKYSGTTIQERYLLNQECVAEPQRKAAEGPQSVAIRSS